jgi:hypothetical protein
VKLFSKKIFDRDSLKNRKVRVSELKHLEELYQIDPPSPGGWGSFASGAT